MPAFYGGKLTTFEDSEKESEYGYVRKLRQTLSFLQIRVDDASQKFEDPAEGEDTLVAKFKKLYDDMTSGFRALGDETR